ncbi:hydroxymethylglutaryl-CoA lyase [uncultured Clostridium sp.]|uniref:hydroxymethylglutaryl-CoA lyase n=1 Tax=uncultured Clostridium sp. TaxID=59620 RepID=UPI0025DCDEE0|nr:hydroxymethylglutaryl-CoA lyase [uncultured Clostridium sp.]
MKLVNRITLCEVGPRDGLQNETVLLTARQKAELINDMAAAGFRVIEAGSFVSPRAVPQMEDTDEVFRLIERREGVEYRALIANVKGVERAAACGCRKVKLNVSASRSHNLANLNCTPQESVAKFAECVSRAAEYGMGISGSVSMAFGSPWDREIPYEEVKEIVEAYLAVGIDEISLSDASGMAYPTQVYEISTRVKRDFPQVKWWLHFHNTRGLGIANIMAGMEAGFTRFDSSFAGVGGCPFVPGAAGNVATEDVIHLCDEIGVETGIDLDRAMETGRKISGLLGHPTDSYLLRAGKSKDLIRELPTGQLKRK